MGESIPPALHPTVAVALAKLIKTFPRPGALPGGIYAEPKWDGYRTIALIEPDGVTLWSRQGKELTRIFPDLAAALASEVPPPGVVLDGEAVIWNGDRLDFEALQRRMVTSRAALPALVKELPAAFAVFDVLAVAGQNIRGIPFTGRRALLEELSRDWTAPLNLSPHHRPGTGQDLAQGLTRHRSRRARVQGRITNLRRLTVLECSQETEVLCQDVNFPVDVGLLAEKVTARVAKCKGSSTGHFVAADFGEGINGTG